jgi:hypothetical protein
VGYINKKYIVYALIAVTIGYTILNWGNRGMKTHIDDAYLIKNVPHSTLNYEGMAIMASPKWLSNDKLWETQIPKSHLEVITGDAEVKEVSRNSTKHMYVIYARQDTKLKENTLYFPGWNVFVDNNKTQLEYTDPKDLGKIFFNVKKGLHYVEVSYHDIPVLKTAKDISLFGYIALIILIVILKFKKK